MNSKGPKATEAIAFDFGDADDLFLFRCVLIWFSKDDLSLVGIIVVVFHMIYHYKNIDNKF
jgi:hypothetical protein